MDVFEVVFLAWTASISLVNQTLCPQSDIPRKKGLVHKPRLALEIYARMDYAVAIMKRTAGCTENQGIVGHNPTISSMYV